MAGLGRPAEPALRKERAPSSLAATCGAIVLNPTEIIQSFDKLVEQVYGPSMGRLYPHGKDFSIASRWIEAGVTLNQCKEVFKTHLEKRKQRSQTVPTCISYFDNMIRDAIATKAYMETQSTLSPEEQRWKLRIDGWKKKRFWVETWGDPPDSPYCMAPRHLMKEAA